MRSLTARLCRGAFVAATAAVLGLGATAAFAPVQVAKAADHCKQGPCNASCRASGAQYGFCDSVGCVCVL